MRTLKPLELQDNISCAENFMMSEEEMLQVLGGMGEDYASKSNKCDKCDKCEKCDKCTWFC